MSNHNASSAPLVLAARATVRRVAGGSSALSSGWLSAPRTWMEALESRRFLSADLPQSGLTDECSILGPTSAIEVGQIDEGKEHYDGTGLDFEPYGPLPVEAGQPTLDLADVSADHAVVRLQIDADGNLVAFGGDGHSLFDYYAAYDGAIYIDGTLAPAHVVETPDGEYALAPGAATISDPYGDDGYDGEIPYEELYYGDDPYDGVVLDLEAGNYYGTLPGDAAATSTLSLADVLADLPVLTLSIDPNGDVTATDGNGVAVEGLWVAYDGSLYLSTATSDELLGAHVVTDANGAYALAPGAIEYVEDDDLFDPMSPIEPREETFGEETFDFPVEWVQRGEGLYGDVLNGDVMYYSVGGNAPAAPAPPEPTDAAAFTSFFASSADVAERFVGNAADRVFGEQADDALPGAGKKKGDETLIDLIA